MKDVWKLIPRSPAYEVSESGRVRRVETGNVLKPCVRKDGFKVVNLSFNGKANTCLVHSLVAEAFLGTRQPDQIIHFCDGDRQNCRLSNISYSVRSDLVPSAPPIADGLSAVDVARIRALLKRGVSGRIIAEAFGISEPLVSRIKSRKIWRG